MLVDVVPLRNHGTKLSQDELRAARPARGILTLETHRTRREEDRGVVYATLTNAKGSEPLLPALRGAHVAKLKGNQFVIQGVETTVPKIGSSSTYPQAWWCRIADNTVENQQSAGLSETNA